MALTREAASLRAQQIVSESISYTFHLKFMCGKGFEGIAQIAFSLVQPNRDVMLDYSGDEVLVLLVNGLRIEKPERRGMSLVLPWKFLLQGANTVWVIFRSEYDREGVGCISYTDAQGKQYLSTYFQPCSANRAVPVFDQPDLKAPMTLNVVAPEGWRVASNESPIYRNSFQADYVSQFGADQTGVFAAFFRNCQQLKLHCFPPTPRLSTYLYCWVAGDYMEMNCSKPFRGMPMNIFCTTAMTNRVQRLAAYLWQITAVAMEYYEQLFGCPYPFRKYEFALVDNFRVLGMEHPGLVTINSSQFFGERARGKLMFKAAQTIAHQLAHSWFGNLTTMRWWDDLWLKESFADFVSFACLESIRNRLTVYRYGPSMVEFLDRKSWGYRQDEIPTTHPIRAEVPNTEVAESIFDGITYSKGAAVLSQLMFVMGQESFTAANAAFFKKYAWKNASFDDLIGVMQQHYRNEHFTLAQWKELWLERACLNQIEPFWDPLTSDTSALLRIQQSWILPEHATLRMHKIQIAFFDKDCKADILDCLILPHEWTTVQYNASRKYEAILLNYGDHSFVKISLDPHSLLFFERNFSRVSDSLVRAMLWTIFFNMVRDARIPSLRFIDLFTSNISQEQCQIVFANQLDAAFNVIHKYTPLELQASLGERVFFFLADLLAQSTKSPEIAEIILAKLNLFLFSARAKQTYIDWWQGRYTPLIQVKMGLAQEWEAVVSAFSLPDFPQEQCDRMIEVVRQRTSPASAQFYLNKCAALRANKQQFEQLYQSYKLMDGSSNQGSMSGFSHPNHMEWIEESYVDRYFADVAELSQSMSSDALMRFLTVLQPNCRDIDRLIRGYQQLIPKLRNKQRVAKEAAEILHELKKRKMVVNTFRG